MTNPDDAAHPGPGIGAGLTKREWYAGLAMQGLCTNLLQSVEGNNLIKRLEKDAGIATEDLTTLQVIARNATAFSDALIAELNKPKETEKP